MREVCDTNLTSENEIDYLWAGRMHTALPFQCYENAMPQQQAE